MSLKDLISILSSHYSSEITHLVTSKDKIPKFTLDLMHFIDISPYWGICLLYRPLDIIPDYKNCIVSIQRSFVRDHDVTTNFTFNIKNSPVVVNSLIEVNSQLNNLVSVRSLTVKSLSEAKTLINAAEYYCNSCTHSFIAYADLTYGNHIEHPIICKAKMLKIPDVNILPRTRLQDRGFVWEEDEDEKCIGGCFDVLDNSYKYSDYQEAIITDGKEEILVILSGSLCQTVKPGDSVDMTGILTMKFNKELILNQTIDAQYTFIAYDIKKAKSINLPKTGVSYLKDYFSKVSDFSRREIILRSAFPNVFGNFYAKFGILLNCIAYFGKSCSNLLILGESGTGKSTFVTALNRLFSPNIKTLNGALTYKSCLNKSFLKNSTTGNFEAGLLESQDLLCFDDFHVLKDKPLIFKAMESRSILCFVTLLDDSQLISKSKYEFNICKGGKLTPEMDRFDLILKLMRNDTNVEFCIRKLSDLDMEDSSNIWDIDTIRSYMHSLLRPLDEITIQDRRIESLLGKFIEYMITFNMKVTYDNAPSGMSVRLLESIIKLTKANAILMGHGEVTLEDTYDILLLIYLSTQDDSSILNQVYIDPVLHREQIEMLKFNIELCVGPIM